MTESPDLITQLRDALDEHAARLRAANEQSARNLRQLERIDTILEGGQIDQANGERERKILNLVASYHLTHGNPLIAQRLAEPASGTRQEAMEALRAFGPDLRRLREKHRIYLGELAGALGCKTTALSDLELGLTGAAGSRAPSTADWDALNHPAGPDDGKAHDLAVPLTNPATSELERDLLAKLAASEAHAARWLRCCALAGWDPEADARPANGPDKLVAFIERGQALLVKPLRDELRSQQKPDRRAYGYEISTPERIVELATERIQADAREIGRLRAANRDVVAKIESAPGSGLRKRLKEAERIAGNPGELAMRKAELVKVNDQIRMATRQRDALHAAAREEAIGTPGPSEAVRREAYQANLAELRALLGGHETADSAQVLRGAIDAIARLRDYIVGSDKQTLALRADYRALANAIDPNIAFAAVPLSLPNAETQQALLDKVRQLVNDAHTCEQHRRRVDHIDEALGRALGFDSSAEMSLDARIAAVAEQRKRLPAQIANDAMPPGYKLIVHTNEHGSTAYRWTMPLTEGQNWPSPAEALRGAWERTTHRDREGFAELEALMQEINGILRASARGRDSQTSVSVIREGFAELAEIRSLILATGRTMNNLSAPQVLREVLAEAGEAAHARADLEKLMAEKARPVVTMPTISATPDARDMDRIRDLLHERRARLAARDGEACTWPELVRGLLDDLHTADLNAAHMEAKLEAAELGAARLAELDAAWAKIGYTRPLTAESIKYYPGSGRYLPLD